MRFFIVFIFVLFGSFTTYSAYSVVDTSFLLPAHLEGQLEPAQQAVWRTSRLPIGTVFFISPRHVVTNWHVIHNQDMDSLSLLHQISLKRLSVKRLVSVSVHYDLALLETEEDSVSHLTAGEGIVSDEENLFLLGYPNGFFKYTLKTSDLKKFKNDIFTHFSVNRTEVKGYSGGPVLDANNKVVGVLQGGKYNYTRMIKGSILRKFISGDIGLSCEGLAPQDCIEEEINNLQEQAERGSQTAQYQLAAMYNHGMGVKQDVSVALKWFGRAAEQGYAPAQSELGGMYYSGKGVVQDFSLALDWFGRAAKQGYIMAQHNLGVLYDKSEGVVQDFSLALLWYHRAAGQGYAPSQNSLGVMYGNDKGVVQDFSLALDWFGRAAKQGYVPAQYNLGMMYYYGKGVEEDVSLAMEWFLVAAMQGHKPAQYMLRRDYSGWERLLTTWTRVLRQFGSYSNISGFF